MAISPKIDSGLLSFAGFVTSVHISPIDDERNRREYFWVFLIAVALSIPAIAISGFAQIIGDVRAMENSARLQK
jgi:hypothetical protein